MSRWFGPVALALTLILAISAIEAAAAGTSQMALRQQATSQQATSQQATSETTDISSRRQHRRLLHHEATGAYYQPGLDGVYPRYYPGRNAVRECTANYVQEYRLSGTVIVPRMSCFWRPG